MHARDDSQARRDSNDGRDLRMRHVKLGPVPYRGKRRTGGGQFSSELETPRRHSTGWGKLGLVSNPPNPTIFPFIQSFFLSPTYIHTIQAILHTHSLAVFLCSSSLIPHQLDQDIY